jgi:hypothetical protein
MNRHFTDARYYFRRGFESLFAGIDEETAPYRERLADDTSVLRRRLLKEMGREEDVEEEVLPTSRRERVEHGARRAATRGRSAAGKVRRRVGRTSQ